MGARFGAAPVTLAVFMTMVPANGAAAANIGGAGGFGAGTRLGAEPVTLAGFITMVSRPCVGVRTGAGGGI
jgi:hypothetical protein